MRAFYQTAAFVRNIYWSVVRPVTLGVAVLALKEGKVLLVKQSYSANWTLPGGAVERAESLEQAACRELLEETGFSCQPENLKLKGVFLNRLHGSSNHAAIFYAYDCVEMRTFVPNSEIVASGFFGHQELPVNMSTLTRQLVESCFKDL